jgi:uncharacterized protein (DUF2237 family)
MGLAMGLVMGLVLIEMCWAAGWKGAGTNPLTGFYRDGCARAGRRQHTI